MRRSLHHVSLSLALAISVGIAAPAGAQSQASRVEATASVSWFRLDVDGRRYAPRFGVIVLDAPGHLNDVYGPEWPTTWAWQASGGYFWTPHFKSQVDVARSGSRTDTYDSDPPCTSTAEVLDCPAASTFLQHNYRVFRGSVTQQYEFRTGARVRPYLGAGVSLRVDHEHDSRLVCRGSSPCRGEGALEGMPLSRTSVHAAALLGLKIGHRVFWVNELRIGQPERWTLHAGMGILF